MEDNKNISFETVIRLLSFLNYLEFRGKTAGHKIFATKEMLKRRLRLYAPSLNKTLNMLFELGLISMEKEGRRYYISITDNGISLLNILDASKRRKVRKDDDKTAVQ